MKRIGLISLMIVVALLLFACSSAKKGETATLPATATMEAQVAPTHTPFPTYTPQPTYTPRPTDPPPPTATAVAPTVRPSETTEPTATATLTPQEPTATATPTAVSQEETAPSLPATRLPAAQPVDLTHIEDADPGPPLAIQVSTLVVKENGTYKLTGTVRNDGDGIYGGVGVIATFFTHAPPPHHHGPVEVYAACSLLAPGAECPFSLEIYPREYVSYHLHPKGAPVAYQPASLILSDLSVTHDNFGYLHITGTATNGNPFSVRDAYIFGTLIDAAGQIVSVGMTLAPGEIASGARVAFDIRIEQAPYSRYEVQAQATQN